MSNKKNKEIYTPVKIIKGKSIKKDQKKMKIYPQQKKRNFEKTII